MDWALNYSIPWSKLPNEIQKPLKEGKRLMPSMRRNFIQIVTDDIAKIVEKPGKNPLAIIATEMVAKYPQSLADSFFDEVVRDGHTSILKQMITRFDNNNRLSPYNVLKRSIKNKMLIQRYLQLTLMGVSIGNLHCCQLPKTKRAKM